uniref:Shedu immune nuclease family protein n=1 Tax=Flavobacterium sp. TaxID=239 RepID=UPI0025C0451D
ILSDAVQDYSTLLSSTITIARLEKKWQEYLKINSWIFSSIFAQPIILFKDEAYVGGKDINNTNGKFSDYLMKNKLSDNVTFLEIKTHKTQLLSDKAYRGTDVYSVTEELSGCINQVLNQRDNFQKEYDHLKRKSKENFETINSKCIVIIGQHKSLTEEQKHCFELFRNNCRDVEIITFDELLLKIQNILTLKLKK